MLCFAQHENKYRACLWSLWLLAMLYLCRDSMYCREVIGFEECSVIQFALFGLMGVYFLLCNRHRFREVITDRRIVFAAAVSVIMVFPMLLKRDWQLMYFSILFAVLYSVLVSFMIDLRTLSRLYVICIICLAGASILCTYCLRFLADAGIAVPPILSISTGTKYYNYGISTVFIGSLRWRSLSIFREPGVYQFFLILALYLHNDVCEWKNKWIYWTTNIFLGFSVLTTLAFGGIVEMALLIVVLFFAKGWYKDRRALLIAAVSIAAMIAAYNIIHWIDGPLWGEIWMLKHKFTTGGESVTDRFGSITANLELFLKSPLVGADVRTILWNPAVENNTSSTTIIMAMFGILGAAFHIVSWIVLTWKKDRNILFNLLFALILAMAFNTENMVADIFLWLFPVMAICEKILKQCEVRQ